MKKLLCVLVPISLYFAALAAEPAHWAYPLVIEKPIAPGHDEKGPVQVPGSSKSYTVEQIDNLSEPPDWFPNDHAPMPAVVKTGGGRAVPACASCHLVSGMGHPESSHLAGLPAAYQMRQLADFKSGARKDSARMNAIAAGLSEEDARQASEWFAALKPRPWTKVVESDAVPSSFIGKGRMRYADAGGAAEPLGNRIAEFPEDPIRAAKRDPYSGFVAHVPKGSVAKGETLVKTGGAGKTIACAACHGERLQGMGEVPRIAGISPLYAFRQLHGVKTGARGGSSADMMKPVVAQLTEDDMLAIVAYLATLNP